MELIRKVTAQVVAAMNENDVQSFFSVVSNDAVFFPPNEPPKSGKELRNWMNNFLNQYTVHFDRYVDEEIVQAGDLVINHYSYVWTVIPKAGGDSMIRQGHGIRILKLQADGLWKITREIWSIYRPPTSAS
jgi:uncharacterized protein (TIGR02246 family)